ncbi:hypothetical protein [Bombilactobacillus thymidiniphilus]|uniref:Uncharacterized protein n=1 Tax=Bombilactobacillus thymidiniphilus TaxID=2923363 RepID=A0ABY4PBR2_9LACO|nr:hypothetical protein [Bombilactobacillus thymidiniphilus]UQS83084.1 hypothetical protein MOO47_04670 [Bombilactobacillus thymidiniphilus]
MKSDKVSQLADWLEDNVEQIVAHKQYLDVQKVYELLDNLAVLRQPVQDYLTMTEEDYYENESDHRLTLHNSEQVLADLADRVLVNHVDGSFINSEINFSYNHENPYFTENYDVQVDLHLIEYALEVIGAVASNTIMSDVRNNLSPDAVLSVALAAHAVGKWQQKNA